MILLQSQAIGGSGGMFGGMEILQSLFGQFGVFFLMKVGIFLMFLYWSLSETLKVYARRNIGKKAFSFKGAIAGATVYLGWGIFLFFSVAGGLLIVYQKNHGFKGYDTIDFILMISISLYAIASGIISSWAAFKILNRAMHEYYRAKSENSQEWRVLEYRGDSQNYNDYANKGWSQERIWQKADPKEYLKLGYRLLLPFFFFSILLIINSIIFMIHEWYVLTYLPNKQKEEYLNMKIEMEKARMQYSNTNIQEESPRVRY